MIETGLKHMTHGRFKHMVGLAVDSDSGKNEMGRIVTETYFQSELCVYGICMICMYVCVHVFTQYTLTLTLTITLFRQPVDSDSG